MAVLPQCPEIQVSVVVGDMEGQPATEFDDSTDPTTETNEQTQHGIVSKYIESREGARFGFKFTADSGFLNKVLKKGEKLWFNVWLDGVSISGRLLGRSAYTANLFHNDIGQNRRKLYKFAALQTVDEGSAEQIKKDSQIAKEMGLFKISVSITKITDSSRTYSDDVNSESKQLHEKTLKGRPISHHAAADIIEGPDPRHHHTVQAIGSPLGVFYFKYRSLDGLYNEGIVPRPRSPSPSGPEATSVDDMDIEQLRRLARERIEQLNNNVKREGTHDPRSKRRIIKREREQDEGPIDIDALEEARAKRPKVTIDLTDD